MVFSQSTDGHLQTDACFHRTAGQHLIAAIELQLSTQNYLEEYFKSQLQTDFSVNRKFIRGRHLPVEKSTNQPI